MYRDTTNVEYEMYGYVGNNRSHRKSDERFKEKFGNHTKKIFNIFTKKATLGTSHTKRTVLHSET